MDVRERLGHGCPRATKQIQPFLRTYKAKRAELIIRNYLALTPRNGKYNKEMLLARKSFDEEVLLIKPAKHF